MCPSSAPHGCTQPGCSELVPRGQARCTAHTLTEYRSDAAARGTASERRYDSRWRAMRDAHLREHPLCLMCLGDDNRPTPGVVVDHIRPWQSGETEAERDRLFNDPTNLQTLCVPHDRKKSAGDRHWKVHR